MTYELEWLGRGLYRRFSGAIDGEEIANSNLRLHGDPRFDDLQFMINDFSRTDAINIGEGDLSLIAYTDKIGDLHTRDIKIAIVLNHPKRTEWFDQYFQEMGPANFDVQIFENSQAAMQWVGLS